MERKWRRIVGAGVALLTMTIAGSASAQRGFGGDYTAHGPAAGEFEFTLSGSGGSDEHIERGSFGFATSLGYYATEAILFGARHNMIFFDADDTDSSIAATSRIFVDYHFDLERLRPYVGVNLGARYGDDGVDEAGTVAPEWGIKFFALEKTFIQASMEYQFFFDDVDDADNRADDGQFVYGLGLGFAF